MSSASHSITRWIERLKQDDPDAARVLWERFVERMRTVARQRLRHADRRVADEEDVVQVAFERFYQGVRHGRFPRLNDRNDLWALLFTLTERYALRQARDLGRQRRGGGQVGGSLQLEEAPEPIDDAPTPAEALLLQDNLDQLLTALDDSLRQIALARMEGYSNAELAQQLGCAGVTVERRLRLIRAIWQQHEADEECGPP